ncbi:DUF2931 family protein [Fulvimonas sp. R45]|uniref:DUF2931 family protein n=1 Tax=Fulvimonas sp. R45 TaxID=3045937 RepID=UPI00265E00F0|nr:DUF2931 family protein [Fulvimonas sp. R45]MDO1527883.1 DUF2931 family protein [Fulvimonas sp. R45]
MKRGLLWLFGLTLALTACASETHLPYRSWYLSFSDVPHMQVWVEDAQVVDVTGRRFHDLSPGALGDDNDPDDVSPAGWATSSGYGKGYNVTGAALPRQVYVRWQSLAEPRTYQATVDIPDSVRKLMLTKGPPDPNFKHMPPDARYYTKLNLGLAPGGWIRVWVGGVLEDPIPVMCVKATVVPQGPGLGKMKGHYAKLSPRAKAYVATHAIPYGSWDCNAH